MLKTAANAGGAETCSTASARSIADRAQRYKELAGGPFFGFNRPGAKVSRA